MLSNKCMILIMLFSLTAPFFAHSKVIIWDLGGVLFKTNQFGMARSIGIGRFISYALADMQSPNIRPLLFDVLGSFGSQQGHEKYHIKDEKGQVLPQIMCDWLTGKKAGYDLIDSAHMRIEEFDQQGYFISNREKDLLKETIAALFDPEVFAEHTQPIKAGLKLLGQCASHTDETGQPHTLIVLSNWDPHSFDLVHEIHQDIFDHFDHIVISGDIGLAKPHPSCFQHLITAYNLNPQECYFIDDQPINVMAAEECQMNGLLLENGNYRDLKKRMREHGLLA